MKSVKYLLIGGGLSSAGAAKKIRQVDPQGSILIVAAEPHMPYNRPPLDKEYMQGKKTRGEVFVEDQEFWDGHNIELIVGQSVLGLDAAGKTANLSDGRSVAFDKALLATGGRPRRLPIRGGDLPGVYHFRTLDDAIGVSDAAQPGKRAVIVGGGFIALELAASLVQRGMTVSLVHRGDRIWSHFADEKLADFVQDYCRGRGVNFHMNANVLAVQGNGLASAVALDNGQAIACDLVVITAGIELNTGLAAGAGLAMDNGVIVDEHMQTSHPDIYAAGDIANFPDPRFGTRRRVEHWGQADYTGTLAGSNMAGAEAGYDLLTYVWSDVFDLHMEMAGDETACDETIVRGQPSAKGFALLHLKGERMTAYYAVNLKKAKYRPLGKLIEQKVNLRGKRRQLEDPDFDVNDLLAAPAGAGK